MLRRISPPKSTAKKSAGGEHKQLGSVLPTSPLDSYNIILFYIDVRIKFQSGGGEIKIIIIIIDH